MEKNSTLNYITNYLRSERENMDSVKSAASPEPSRDMINNILNYSKALKIVKSKKIGYLELVLN